MPEDRRVLGCGLKWGTTMRRKLARTSNGYGVESLKKEIPNPKMKNQELGE